MLKVKLKDRNRNTIIRQRTRVTDIVQYLSNTKWKWGRHIARVKDNYRWTIRSTEWQIKVVRSIGVVGEMTSLDNREQYGQG